MNEKKVVLAIKALLEANEDKLMTGLVHQNSQRSMTVTTSNLTPPSSYYWLLVYATDVVEKTQPTASRTTSRGSRITRYSINIELGDEAQVQVFDEQAYETMHNDFRTFSDRVVALIEENVRIGNEPTLTLERDPANDRVVTKSNLSGTWKDTEDTWWASLYCRLRFNLVDGCGTTDLYS